MADETGPHVVGVLAGVRVLDWTEQDGAYAGRLLADLGADVVRLETATDDGPWPEEPIAGDVPSSGFERFVNLNKRSLRLDLTADDDRALISRLLQRADVVLTSKRADLEWRQANTGVDRPYGGTAIHVSVSAFGTFGPGAPMTSDDLVALASGGLLSLGGYPDRQPVAVYGSQTYFAGGIAAAVAALLALIGRRQGMSADEIDVSTQAVIASALEDAPAEFDLTGAVRHPTGDEPREAGTGTFACSDGLIAIVAGKLGTARAWDSLVQWMIDDQVLGAEEFAGPGWTTLEHRRSPESIVAFRSVFESFLSRWDQQGFYAAAQARGISVAPVNSLSDVMQDVQLVQTGFFQPVEDKVLGRTLTYPGPPYRLLDHDVRRWVSAPAVGADRAAVLEEWLGLQPQQVGAGPESEGTA